MTNAPRHRLAEVPLFAGLSPELLDRLAVGRPRPLQPEQVLFSEGEKGDSLVVLEEGQLRVSRLAPSGQEVVLAVVKAPAALGELALLDGKERDADVTAQGPAVVRFVPRSTFLELLRDQPAFVEGLLATLAGWVRHANERHLVTVSLDVPGRLAKWLLSRSESEGSLTFKLERTQEQLANELNTTRSTVNKALQDLKDLGYVEGDTKRVKILDKEALRMYLG